MLLGVRATLSLICCEVTKKAQHFKKIINLYKYSFVLSQQGIPQPIGRDSSNRLSSTDSSITYCIGLKMCLTK